MIADWIWYVFVFAFGSCIGSFLNVVIYRLPRDKSLVSPGSSCTSCGKAIRFYDNIPLLSWLLLFGKCRHCKAPISVRYFTVELFTGAIYTWMFYFYFRSTLAGTMVPFLQGGWFVYIITMVLLSALIAASAIDLELWGIPISICWLVTAAAMIGSALEYYVMAGKLSSVFRYLPVANNTSASLAAGGAIGLVISLILLRTGIIKASYESENCDDWPDDSDQTDQQIFEHRIEVCRELLFLLPIILFSVGAYFITQQSSGWQKLIQNPAVAGFLGSLWGYFTGCAIVWATRILGTLAFGKEAMGLGDVHLMGAAGAVIGPIPVVIAFFIAPFFGLAWAVSQMFFKKIRQIPYGPFLSIGIFTVIVLKDRITEMIVQYFGI